MSITSIRKMIENKGCQAGLIVIAALSLIGLAGVGSFRGMFGGMGGTEQAPDLTPAVLELGSIKMTEAQYQSTYQAATEQMGMLANQDPDFRLRFMAQAADSLAQQAALKALANDSKITIDDKAVLKLAEEAFSDQVKQQKQILIATGKLKPDATAAETDDVFKKEAGIAASDYISQQIEAVKTQLKDPAKREGLLTSALGAEIVKSEAAKHPVSDEVLKQDYDQFTLDQIPFQDATVPVSERTALATKASDDLKAGKTIDEVRKAYAPKETTAPVTMTRAMLSLDSSLKQITSLKVGEWTPVLTYQGFPVLYRVAKIEPKLPTDFDKDIAKYRESHSMTIARDTVTKAIDEKKKQIKWLSPGLELCVRFEKETGDRETTADSVKRKAVLQKLHDDAKALGDKAPPDPKSSATIGMTTRIDDEVSALVLNATSKQLYSLATPSEQQDLAKGRLEDMKKVTQYVDSTNLRLDIVDIALKAGDNESAAENLIGAAGQLGRPDATVDVAYANISKKLETMKAAKQINEESAKRVQDALTQYLKDKVDLEKQTAEQKKFDEERQKTMKAEDDKAAADRKAAEEKNKKPGDDKKATGDKKPAEPAKGQSPENQFLKPEGTKGG